MKLISAETARVTIEMAGDVETAKRWLRRFCYGRGLCVTVEPQTFIYTGGEEVGFSVGLLNYPRFPSELPALEARALEIAEGLIVECCQKTALIVGPRLTQWLTLDPPGMRTAVTP